MSKIPLTKVNSTNIDKVGYSEEKQTLYMLFITDKKVKPVYSYHPVTKDMYLEMMNSDSVGSYFSKNIRNNPNIKCKKS